MIIANFNAADDQLWRWFDIPGSGGAVELKLISRDELVAMGRGSDPSAHARYIVRHCFRAFRGMADCNGVDIPNTEDNRAVMLTYRPLWNFVTNKLVDLGDWGEEGKGGSGSAS